MALSGQGSAVAIKNATGGWEKRPDRENNRGRISRGREKA